MGPNDPKIQYPLKAFFWHRTMTIRDSMNRELFKLDVMRPSIEAWKELQEWGDKICQSMNEKVGLNPIEKEQEVKVEFESIPPTNGHEKKKGNPWGRKGKPK